MKTLSTQAALIGEKSLKPKQPAHQTLKVK
jgi:hypothetical protein